MKTSPRHLWGNLKPLAWLCLAIVCGAAMVEGQSVYPYYVPPKERIKRIDIERLTLANYPPNERPGIEKLRAEYSGRAASEFMLKPDQERSCRSELLDGITCIEMDARIGYWAPTAFNGATVVGRYFQQLDQWGWPMQAFWDPLLNQFYVRPNKTDPVLYGPFKGEPETELKKAVIPVKERNTFPGVAFKYLSKRWEFPNEKDAMVNRNPQYYDFAGGSPSGREIEARRLQSQFFRFRVENNSGKQLYLLYYNNEPEVFRLTWHPIWTSWSRHTQPKFNSGHGGYYIPHLTWVSLPDKSAIEFETRTGCNLPMTCAKGIYLNDEPIFWDEVEMITRFPGNRPREFTRRNAPPARR